MVVLAVVIGGCGSSGSSPPTRRSPPDSSATRKPAASIVGRWQLSRTCGALLHGLQAAHLRPLAPGVTGEFFPQASPRQLARKHPICEGAGSQRHSHFFTADGRFGSLDQAEKPVDDGTYRLIDDHTVSIGSDRRVTFRYRVVGGNRLELTPVISGAQRRSALAHPLRFSAAGWAVSVAYTGRGWKRVACGGWC